MTEKIIDKITKLLAKAESTTPEEADALFTKAAELMQRYAIDEAMLASAGKLDDEIIQHRTEFRGSYVLAQFKLGCAVGRGFGFKNIDVSSGWEGKRVLVWVGWRRDVVKAELVLASLLIQQAREVKAYARAHPAPPYATAFERFVHRRSHMLGFAQGVQHKLESARRVAEDAAQRDGGVANGSSVALVLVNREDRVAEATREMFPKLTNARAAQIRDARHARAAGFNAGRRADTNATGVSGARGALR